MGNFARNVVFHFLGKIREMPQFEACLICRESNKASSDNASYIYIYDYIYNHIHIYIYIYQEETHWTIAQRVNDVYTTLHPRRCNDMMLIQRCLNVVCPLGGT